MSDRALLDPSLVMAGRGVRLLSDLREDDLEGLILPASFVEMVYEATHLEDLLKFYGIDEDDVNVPLARTVVDRTPDQVPVFHADIALDEVERFADQLDIEPHLAYLVLEEWQFLATESWIFAAVRTVFEKMVEGGALAVETSQEQFEKLARQTLGKEAGDELSPNDRARAVAKWVALSGPGVMSLFEPTFTEISGTVAGVFLHYDP